MKVRELQGAQARAVDYAGGGGRTGTFLRRRSSPVQLNLAESEGSNEYRLMYGAIMIQKICLLIFVIGTMSMFGCAAGGYTQMNRDHAMLQDTLRRMTQQDIINLSKSGVSDSLIINMMNATNTWFQLKAQDVINLRNAGVSEKVIAAMMEEPAAQPGQANSSSAVRYYVYPPYFWYDGFYPYWYYPGVSVRIGGFYRFHSYHHGRFH